MNKVNLTPHSIIIRKVDGSEEEIHPSGLIARAAQIVDEINSIDGIPIISIEYGEIEGLLDPRLDTIYIVSSLAAQAIKGRNDVYVPARPVRDKAGRIIACEALAKVE